MAESPVTFWIDVFEGARLTGYTPTYVRRLLADYYVEGEKRRGVWHVDGDSLLAYKRAKSRRGYGPWTTEQRAALAERKQGEKL